MSVQAVYDCMLFLAHAARPQRVRETFDLVENRKVTLFISLEILAEITDVLTRPEMRAKFPTLTAQAVSAFLDYVLQQASFIENVPEIYTVARDPKDSKYINLALAAGASHLVTRDKDLLILMDQSSAEGRDFRQKFPQLQIVEPRAFVEELNQSVKANP